MRARLRWDALDVHFILTLDTITAGQLRYHGKFGTFDTVDRSGTSVIIIIINIITGNAPYPIV